MSLTVIRRPIVVSGGNTFRFNSIALPTIYEFERRDWTYNQVNNNGGKVQLQFNAVNLTTSFAIGDSVYVKALAGSPYAGNTTITAVAFSGGNTLVTLDITYVSTSTSGFVNNDTQRAGYYIEVRFFAVGGALLTTAIQEVSPNPVGRMIVDISEFAKSFLNPDFGSKSIGLFNIVDDELASKAIYIGYREVWIGSQELETADSANIVSVVLGAQQLPLLNGSNYGVSISRYVSDIDGTVKANWLRKSSSCLAWRGWPISASFLINLDGEYDLVADVSTDVPITESGLLTTSKVSLKTVNMGAIWSGLTSYSYFNLHVRDDQSGTVVTKDLNFRILEPCKNPVMLLFRNSLGGDCWHMFSGSQEKQYKDDNGTKVKRMLLTAENLNDETWEELNDLITYGAELKENIIEVLSTTNKTKSRAYQQVYKVDQDGTLTGVIVIPTNNTGITGSVKQSFDIEIEFPEYFLP